MIWSGEDRYDIVQCRGVRGRDGREGKGMAEKGVLCGARFCTGYSALKGREGKGME